MIFMPARHDHHRVQTGDGYAAYVGGQVVGADRRDDRRAGLVVGRPRPRHRAARADRRLRRRHGARGADASPSGRHPSMNLTVLVDFENDSVAHRARRRACARAAALGRPAGHLRVARRPRRCRGDGRLRAHRASIRGSCTRCATRSTRPASPTCGSSSRGGFDAAKIREFEATGVPVDAYGVGSSLIRGSNDFTADIVVADGEPCGEGRPAPTGRLRLERVD